MSESDWAADQVSLDRPNLAQIVPMFEGLDLIDPGVMSLPLWRPDPEEELVRAPERGANVCACWPSL
jgi:hypothetical protein